MPATLTTATGARAMFAITLTNPGPPVADGHGGWTSVPEPLGPGPVCGSITPLLVRQNYERAEDATTIGHQLAIAMLPYLPGLTPATTLAWTDRGGVRHTASVLSVSDPDGRAQTLEVHIIEVAGP